MPKCSPEDYSRSLQKGSPITCLDTGDSIGITITAEAGLLSLLAILYVLVVIARNMWKRRLNNTSLQVFHHPMDLLVASLFLGDILQAIGAVMSLKWVQNGKVETGNFCDAQGIIKIFGATGVALSTLAIGVFTFVGVVWVNRVASMKFTLCLVASLWSFIGILVAVGVTVHRNKEISFIGPTPYWCWVDVEREWKLVLEYVWLWLALFISILLYIPLFLWMYGILILPAATERWWRFRFTFVTNLDPDRWRSLVMLVYPVVYCLCTLPLSAARWKSFEQGEKSVPPAATFTVVSIFALSGFFNVILLLKTRPSIGLFNHLIFLPARPPQQPDVAPADIPLAVLPPTTSGPPGRST